MPTFLQDTTIISALIAAIVSVMVVLLDKVWLSPRLEKRKVRLEGEKAENAARIQYAYEERKRLYAALGALRFQLLIAARDVAHAVQAYGVKDRRWRVDLNGYYGRSTIYRLLRPLALAEVIESKISVADFSIDPDAIELLNFKRMIFSALSGSKSVIDHPGMDWEFEREHIFHNTIQRMARCLVISKDGIDTIARFDEFEEILQNPDVTEKLRPISVVFDRFDPASKPIFWVRLICYGYLCNRLVTKLGTAMGFSDQSFPIEDLVRESEDEFFIQNFAPLRTAFEEMEQAHL